MNNTNIDTFCREWRTGLRCVWNLPNTTRSDLLHLLSDDFLRMDAGAVDELFSRIEVNLTKAKQSKAKQRCVMGVGMCLYAQLVQTKNK